MGPAQPPPAEKKHQVRTVQRGGKRQSLGASTVSRRTCGVIEKPLAPARKMKAQQGDTLTCGSHSVWMPEPSGGFYKEQAVHPRQL
eukprot:8155151-Prorocentrum_lima.AAC.1